MCPSLIHPETGERVRATQAGAAVLRERGYTDAGGGASPAAEKPSGEKTIDEMTGKELDAFAAELEIADWNAKAKVDAKKETVKALVAQKITELAQTETKPLEEATDEQLHELAVDLGVEFTDEELAAEAGFIGRDILIAAIRRTQAAASE